MTDQNRQNPDREMQDQKKPTQGTDMDRNRGQQGQQGQGNQGQQQGNRDNREDEREKKPA